MTAPGLVVHQRELSIKFGVGTRFGMLSCLDRLSRRLSASWSCDLPYRSYYYDTAELSLTTAGISFRLADRLDEADGLAALICKRRHTSEPPVIHRTETALCVGYDWRVATAPSLRSLAVDKHFELPEASISALCHVATCLQRRRKLICRFGKGYLVNISADEILWNDKGHTAFEIGLEINGPAVEQVGWQSVCRDFLLRVYDYCLELGLHPGHSTKLEEHVFARGKR
jgi:hypothetical protein